MTAPKRWPKNAESSRVEALAAAREISSLGVEAKGAIQMGKRELALYLVGEMQLAAKEIELQMRTCKGGGR